MTALGNREREGGKEEMDKAGDMGRREKWGRGERGGTSSGKAKGVSVHLKRMACSACVYFYFSGTSRI